MHTIGYGRAYAGEGREVFQELLANIRAGSGDVSFVSVTEGFDTTSATGRAMLVVAAVFAQLTREMIAE